MIFFKPYSVIRIFICYSFFILYSNSVFSQSAISGIWEGKFLSTEFNLGQPKLVVEIFDVKDEVFTGISHLYYKGNYYEHYKILGWFDKKDSLIVFREVSTIAVDLGIYGNCLGTYKMSIKRENNYLFQIGLWYSNIKFCSPTTNVWLKKIDPSKKPETIKEKQITKNTKPATILKKDKHNPQPLIIEKKEPEPIVQIKKAPDKLPVKITQRLTDVQSLLEIAAADKDSIRVDIYDNGEVDGDSVSVYEDDKLRVDKKRISTNPITFFVSLNRNHNPITHLRLVAENLGTIPPCTALMIVTTKSKRYEVRLSSNFSKNASVELFLKE